MHIMHTRRGYPVPGYAYYYYYYYYYYTVPVYPGIRLRGEETIFDAPTFWSSSMVKCIN